MNLQLSQGSLLKRTLLHVVVFVGASAAFIALVSFASVRVARAALGPAESASTAAATPSSTAKPGAATRPGSTDASASATDVSASKGTRSKRNNALRNRNTQRQIAPRVIGKDG